MKNFSKGLSIAVLFFFTFLNFYLVQKVLSIKTHYSLEQFQPKNHPLLTNAQKVRDRFKITSSMPYLMLLEAKSNSKWADPHYLNELHQVTQQIKKLPEVESVISLANIETAMTDENSFTVGRIKDITKNQQQRLKILQDPLIAPHLVSNDGKVAALIIEVKSLSFGQQVAFMKKIKNLTEKKQLLFSTEIGGPSAISAQMADLLSNEIVLYTTLSLIISQLILFAIFRNWSVLVISFMLVVSSNIVSIGILSWLGLSLTVLSSTVPIIVTLTVVSMAAQTLSRLSEFKNKVLEKHRHIIAWRVIKGLAGSHILATLTTVIGFATLIPSQIPIISDYGTSVTIAILVTCAVCLTLLTACMMLFPIPKKRKTRMTADKSVDFLMLHKKFLFSFVVAISVLGAFLGANLNWSTQLFDDLPDDHPVKQATLHAEDKLGGVIPLEISIGSPHKENTWKTAENVLKLDALVAQWKQQPGVGSVIAYSDFIKATRPQRTVANDDSSIAQTLFVYSMSNNNPLDHFTTLDHKYARVALRMKDVPSHEIQNTLDKIRTQVKQEFPDLKMETSGLAATVHPINENLSRDLIYGFYTAMLWIILMLSFVFRSLRWALVSAIPNLVPPALLLGILALTNTPIKPSIAIIFAISLGIAFNNTVYILGKLKKIVEKEKLNHLPIEQLMREEFAPCFLSSCAVMAGFSVFLFSYFGMNQIFGTFMVLSVVAGLLGDLVLLPTMLGLFPGLLLKPIRGMLLWKESPMIKNEKVLASVFFVLCILFLSKQSYAAESAMDILKKIEKNNISSNEQAEITMKIQESDGSSKERRLLIKKKSANEQKAMVKLLSPSDLKGVGLLTVSKKGSAEDQWLYLPSEKRARRISGSNKKGRFLDSELSFEDLSLSTYKNFSNKVIENKTEGDKKISVIESLAKNSDDSTYSKIKTWVDTSSYRLLKAEYYDEDKELLKVITFNNYKKYNNLWRAQSVNVKNIKKNRGTTLEIKKVSVKKIPDSDFTMSALEEG